MGDKFNILFVCSGNIFRSLSAEHCLKNYIKKNKIKNINVSSAGITAHKQEIHTVTLEALKEFNISVKNHKQRKLSKEIINKQDLVIAMGLNHQEFIKEKFNKTVPLFNEIVCSKKTPILDIGEKFKNKKSKKAEKYIKKTVIQIHNSMPKLFKKINSTHLLFQNFINKRTKHKNGLPFIPLYETKHSIAFMSIDIPAEEDGHILVCPKKRFQKLEQIPEEIQSDIIKTISIVGKAIMKTHEGYNVLLNNGKCAGQYIFHTHFHIIPRKHKDKIKIEIWKKKKRSEQEFINLSKKFKKEIKKLN
jgi:protein-tyrosine phosphatase